MDDKTLCSIIDYFDYEIYLSHTLTHLRCYFTEKHNGKCGKYNSKESRGQTIQQNGKGGVNQHITQENTAQQIITLISDRCNFSSILSFFFRASIP